MKQSLIVIAINMQSGLIAFEDNLQPVAIYDHHTKSLVWKEGWDRNAVELPANYEDYKDLPVAAGHFNVGFFDNATYKNTDITTWRAEALQEA